MTITIQTIGTIGIDRAAADFVTANAADIAAQPEIAERVGFNIDLALGAYDHALDAADLEAMASRPADETDAIVRADQALRAAIGG